MSNVDIFQASNPILFHFGQTKRSSTGFKVLELLLKVLRSKIIDSRKLSTVSSWGKQSIQSINFDCYMDSFLTTKKKTEKKCCTNRTPET